MTRIFKNCFLQSIKKIVRVTVISIPLYRYETDTPDGGRKKEKKKERRKKKKKKDPSV